jgi:cation transport ATPase
VIGRSPTDEIALSAASVSIALPSVGTPNLDHDVEIATNEVQRAALALSLARQCRTKALYSIGIAAGGSIATVLATVAISAPIAFAPLGCLLFVMIAAVGTNSQSGDAGSLVTRADDAGDRA